MYTLRTADRRTQFRLGESIEIEELYSSSAPDKYLLLASPAKVKGGHSTILTFQPGDGVVDRFRDSGDLSANSILHSNCDGGIGSGFAGDCFDCDGEYLLRTVPIRYTRVINFQFQITQPGLYRIAAQTAAVVAASQPAGERTPIAANSSLDIEVVDDPVWSHTQVSEAVTAFHSAQADFHTKGWDRLSLADAMRETPLLQAYDQLRREMAKAADTLRFLDTEESLIESVRLYEGSDTFGYINSLYFAITQSKHQALAVELLESRIMEADFPASERLLDQLLAMKLRVQFPSAVNGASSNASLYPLARKILQDYVLALGRSLAGKEGQALNVSASTFGKYAAMDFCTSEPLIPRREAAHMLKAAGQPVHDPP
jgi:hypothetical protein